MKEIAMFFIIFFLIFSTAATAEPWSEMADVTTVYPHTEALIFVTTYVNTQISTCDNGRRFSISKDHPNYDVMVSTMLAAFMGSKRITFHIESNQQDCQPTIDRFRVAK